MEGKERGGKQGGRGNLNKVSYKLILNRLKSMPRGFWESEVKVMKSAENWQSTSLDDDIWWQYFNS